MKHITNKYIVEITATSYASALIVNILHVFIESLGRMRGVSKTIVKPYGRKKL